MIGKNVLTPRIIPRSEHSVSRKDINPNALKVLYRLSQHGYDAYLVGGCVRDLLLNHHPKDFDVATNAKPEEVKAIFSNCRLIGRRFRLAHVYFGGDVVEVATFRGHHDQSNTAGQAHDNGLILRDNVYGSIEEDACRRDFTINALYYNIKDFSVVDFTGGAEDLRNRRLRIIGDPETRYREDPVRMLRAIRFIAKLDMKVMPKTAKPIKELTALLAQIAPARLFDEVVKLFHTGHAEKVYPALRQYYLFQILFPKTDALLNASSGKKLDKMLQIACSDTDSRIKIGKSVSCAYLFAILLWGPLEAKYQELLTQHKPTLAMQEATHLVLSQQQKVVSLPRRFMNDVAEIWRLQARFSRRQPKASARTLNSPRFRAGFDLLTLRSKVNPKLKKLVDWWQAYQDADSTEKAVLLDAVKKNVRNSD